MVGGLTAEGYHIHPVGRELLAALGGFRIVPPRLPAAAFWSGPVLVDPVWAATGGYERAAIQERQLEQDFCPIAEWCDEYILLLGEDGSVIAETTGQVLQIGSSSGLHVGPRRPSVVTAASAALTAMQGEGTASA